MGWTVTKEYRGLVVGSEVFAAGCWSFRRGGTLKAVAHKRGKRWLVWRVTTTLGGNQYIRGCDDFSKFSYARAFVVNNPGVWGTE